MWQIQRHAAAGEIKAPNDHQRSSRIQIQKMDHVQKLRPTIYNDNKVPFGDDTRHPSRLLLVTGTKWTVFGSSGLEELQWEANNPGSAWREGLKDDRLLYSTV